MSKHGSVGRKSFVLKPFISFLFLLLWSDISQFLMLFFSKTRVKEKLFQKADRIDFKSLGSVAKGNGTFF